MGIKPRVPAALIAGHAVEPISTDEYVERLSRYFKETYAPVERVQREHSESLEPSGDGRLAAELKRGDVVLVKREPTVGRSGPLRFQSRVYPDLYRVSNVISAGTFQVEPVVEPGGQTPFGQPLNAARLVGLDMPEIPLDPGQPGILRF